MIDFANERITITPEAAEQQWSVRRATSPSTQLYAIGQCPACGARLEVPIDLEVVFTATVDTAATRLTRTLHCNCREPHSGRPPETPEGCGRSWALTFVENGDTFTVEPGDLAVSAASDELSQVAASELSSLRTAGEKWIAGVTALLGLFGISGIAIGKDSVKALDAEWKVAAAAIAGLGLIAAVVSIVFGYQAAYGWPKKVDVRDDNKLKKWFEGWTSRGSTTVRKIHTSVIAAVTALTLLTVAAGIIWFGPAADPPSPKVLVKYNQDGDTSKPGSACGSLEKSSDGMIHVQVADGGVKRTVRIRPSWTTSLAPSASC